MYKIMLVDDERLEAQALNIMIEESKEQVIVIGTAENGREAVELNEKIAPDIILMDVSMPKMDGIEALKSIKRRNKETVIIMLIEYCNHELIDRILALGGDDYLVKPIRKENLLNSITEHIISLKTNKHLLKERELLILDKIILDKRDDAEELLKDIVESYSLISGGNLEAFKKYINEIGSKIIKISNKIGSKSNQVLNEEEYKHELKLLKDRESINRLIVNLLNSVFKDQLKNSVQWRLINDKHVSKNLEPALKYIEENYKEKISLEKAANVCNLSMYYFSKLFKRDTEMKFIDYISMYKVEKAKEMLKDTNVPVVNIAIDLGYDESGYFTKVFKKIVGLTPSEYRDINFK